MKGDFEDMKAKKWKALASLLTKILSVMYALGLVNGYWEFMQNKSLFIQCLPFMFALIIATLCEEEN